MLSVLNEVSVDVDEAKDILPTWQVGGTMRRQASKQGYLHRYVELMRTTENECLRRKQSSRDQTMH